MPEDSTGLEISNPVLGSAKLYGGKDINTIATLLTLIGVAVMLTLLVMHFSDTKDSGKEFVSAIREQTVVMKESAQATREASCLARFSEQERPMRADWCKQISR